jgi:catalase
LADVSNSQREGQMRYGINKGRVSYAPASLDGHTPEEATPARGGYVSYPESVNRPKVRQCSESFGDYYGQAKLFWNSMALPEKEHIAKALQSDLSKVETREARQRMLRHLEEINGDSGRAGRRGFGGNGWGGQTWRHSGLGRRDSGSG